MPTEFSYYKKNRVRRLYLNMRYNFTIFNSTINTILMYHNHKYKCISQSAIGIGMVERCYCRSAQAIGRARQHLTHHGVGPIASAAETLIDGFTVFRAENPDQ
jgi:hypothetical protein